MPSPKKPQRVKKVKAWAFISKFNGEIMEAYADFDMAQVALSLKGARIYAKKIYTKKQWPNWQKDIKIVPITISYQPPQSK